MHFETTSRGEPKQTTWEQQGGAPQTRVLAPPLPAPPLPSATRDMSRSGSVLWHGLPYPPQGDSGYRGWRAAQAAPAKSCCEKDMKPRHCESRR